MRGMFRQATYFNSDVSGFNVDSLTTTENMFYLTAFNNGDLGNNSLKPLSWDFTNNTTGLSNISNMFPVSFNQDISSFKLGSINLQYAFLDKTAFNNGGQSLNTWDTSGVTSFFRTFRNTAFNQNIYSWDVSSVTTFVEMFRAKDSQGLKTYMQKFLPHMDDEMIEDFIIGGTEATEGIAGQLTRLGSARDYKGKLEMMKKADNIEKLDNLDVTEEIIRKPNASGGIATMLGE